MAKKNTGKVEKKVQAIENQSQIYRVVTFVRPGMRDSRYQVTRSEGLVILSINGEAVRLTCKQYYSNLVRVEDKKYAQLKSDHSLSEIMDIHNQNKALIKADLEISICDGVNNDWVFDFNSRYPELTRTEIIQMITELGEIQVQ